MDVLKEIAFDEAFEARLREEREMTPEEKRARMTAVDAQARRCPGRALIEDGQRFDRLEFDRDVPMMPACGSVFPSERAFGHRR